MISLESRDILTVIYGFSGQEEVEAALALAQKRLTDFAEAENCAVSGRFAEQSPVARPEDEAAARRGAAEGLWEYRQGKNGALRGAGFPALQPPCC